MPTPASSLIPVRNLFGSLQQFGVEDCKPLSSALPCKLHRLVAQHPRLAAVHVRSISRTYLPVVTFGRPLSETVSGTSGSGLWWRRRPAEGLPRFVSARQLTADSLLPSRALTSNVLPTREERSRSQRRRSPHDSPFLHAHPDYSPRGRQPRRVRALHLPTAWPFGSAPALLHFSRCPDQPSERMELVIKLRFLPTKEPDPTPTRTIRCVGRSRT
jgi:hypothetical protein